MQDYVVTFKTPVDYFRDVLGGSYDNINHFHNLMYSFDWRSDVDLHVYPWVDAVPGLLSVGCPNQCSFCPTAALHKGQIHFGDPEYIIPQYTNKCVHFMDENFFYNDMNVVLPLLRKYNVTWLAMADYKSTQEMLAKWGEPYLYACGLRVIEMGLENVALFCKVKEPIKTKWITIYYLNMTCLPRETKDTISENAAWMKPVTLKRPIHFNNGVWYACGQFFHPYSDESVAGKGHWLDGPLARVRPSWIPNSLLIQDYYIVNLAKANFFNQLVFGYKIYNPPIEGNIGQFIGNDQNRAAWLLTGLRCGAIV